MFRSESVPFTTTSGGAATVYSRPFTGLLHAIRYVWVDGDTGLDATVTDEASGLPILTITNAGVASTTHYPRAATVGVTNAALVYAGTDAVTDRVPVTSRVKIVVAAGGATKTGSFIVFWDDGR